MKLKSYLLAGLLVVASAMAGMAATYNLGDVTGGASTSKVLRTKTIDFLQFSLGAPSGFDVTDFTIAVKSKVGSNFKEAIGLYFGSTLVASAQSKTAGDGVILSFNGDQYLPDGAYTLGIAGRNAFFTPDIANARSTGSFKDGSYTLNISSTISAVPLPSGVLLVLTGLGALSLLRHKRKAA